MNKMDSNFEDMFNPQALFVRSDIIKELLSDLFNNPQKDMKFVHIAGTNGKGSISTMISSILMHSGYKTGLFTSPSVASFMERIKVNNIPMPFEQYKEIRDKIIEYGPTIIKNKFYMEKGISEFTVVTIAAFEYFKNNQCDISVLEAGIGGFKDSTNIIENPMVSVISSISFDHTKTLGNTLEEIAFQKSGIIKPKRPVVVSAGQSKEIYEVISKTAKNNSSELIIPDKSDIELISSDIDNGTVFRYKGTTLKMNLLGEHQLENALTALTAIDVLKREMEIPEEAIKIGMETAFINARLEILCRDPLIILDGAHNESGLHSLTLFIEKYLKDKNIIGILGMCKDKNSTSEFSKILPLFSEVIPVEIPRFPRTMPISKLSGVVRRFSNNVTPIVEPEQAIKYAIQKCEQDTCILIFGSLYLARRIIRNPHIIEMLKRPSVVF